MKNETYLYKASLAEARQNDQVSLWRASHRANIACKEAIEESIRQGFDGMHLQEGCIQGVLEEYGFKRVNWVLANTVREKLWDGRFSQSNKEWARCQMIPLDPEHNCDFVVGSHPAVLDGFLNEVRAAFQKLDLFGPEHCCPDSRAELDYEGKVLVLSLDSLKESCWSQENQLWYAHDGFGCHPHAIGRSIRCTCLGDGEETRWNRTDFTGVLKDEFLPAWATEKLRELKVPLDHRIIRQIDQEWNAYIAKIRTLPADEIIARADEISATRLCRSELKSNLGFYDQETLEHLGKMPYLLETVRDQWMSDQDVDHSQEMGYTLNRILMNDAEPQMNESEHFPNSPTMK